MPDPLSDRGVGLVVVSHSRALATAAVELAEQMLHHRQVTMAVAAGLDDGTLGTDAVAISRAVAAADGGRGVVVLMDLGSAVLSAELALDLLADDLRPRVLLCPAPLVEGLVVAAVAAAAGADREEVAAEARNALAGKLSQLSPGPERPAQASEAGGRMARITVAGEHGLHARPAARLVQQLRDLDADVQLRNATTGTDWVSGTSLSQVATLGVLRGHEVEVQAGGRQADEAIDRVMAAAAEDSGPVTAPSAPVRQPGAPMPASPGIAIGPARPAPGEPSLGGALSTLVTGDPAHEWSLLSDALTAVRTDLHRLRDRVARELSQDEAAIFDAHAALTDDSALLDTARRDVVAGGSAATAWADAVSALAARFELLDDPYLRERAGDVRAVGQQVLARLLGVGTGTSSGRDGVLVAADLSPAEAATLDADRVTGVVLAFGGPTSHSAILIRARGIPAVVAAGPDVLQIPDGTLLAVDGSTGEVVVDPPDDILARFRERAEANAQRHARTLARAGSPATTRDGTRILVGANIGSPQDATAARAAGADLAGLLRTEFLFLDREHAPDVEEQEAAYRAVAAALGGRRMTVRTLDVGGDKPLPYLPAPNEANPFLGLRGLRLSLAHPALLAEQLLAVVRVAHDVPVSLMVPMVSTRSELLEARRMLDDAIKDVGRGEPDGLRFGVMVEVPAAALKAASFAPHVDFLSIGTNDLTQYAMAAERGNGALAGLSDPLDPGVLRLIDATCRGAGDALVAVCGELAADERATALLLGLGVRELSVAPAAVPAVKDAVRHVDLSRAQDLAASALRMPDATAVRALVAPGSPLRSAPPS